MIQQIDVLIKDINTKPNWSAKELAPKLQSLSHQLVLLCIQLFDLLMNHLLYHLMSID